MLNIEIKTIPHKDQEYNTVGCHWEKGGKNIINVSDLNNWKYEVLVAIHELVEQSLCVANGITSDDVISFDKKFDKTRTFEAPLEPGDNLEAPYHKEHLVATFFEKEMARNLAVDWEEYSKMINSIYSTAVKDKIYG